MTRIDTAAIRARLDASSPGPWFASGQGPYDDDCTVTVGEDADELAVCPDCGTRGGMTTANAAFISHAPKDIGAQLADRERLVRDPAAATALLEHYQPAR